MRMEQYEKIRQFFLLHKSGYKILKFLYKFLPYVVAVFYFIMILFLILQKDTRLFRILFVPIFIFFVGTAMRSKINAKRPYEKELVPLIPKETKGNSFPSRHLLSAGVIFACAMYLHQFVLILLILSIVIGICRVLAGVHSFLDVIFGFLFGLIAGLFLLFL